MTTRSTCTVAACLAMVASIAPARAGAPKPKASVTPRPMVHEPRVPVVLPRLHPECRDYLVVPSDSTSDELPWMQRLSLAACEERAIASAVIAPAIDADQLPGLVAQLDGAMAGPIALYREASTWGPPKTRLLAAYHLGMVYVDAIVRARIAIRSPDTALHAQLESQLAGNVRLAIEAFDEADHLSAFDPEATHRDEVVRNGLREARRQRALLAQLVSKP